MAEEKPLLKFVVYASKATHQAAFDKYRDGACRMDAELIFQGTGCWAFIPGDKEGMAKSPRSKNGFAFICMDKDKLPPPTDKALFIAQFKHPKGTCFSPWVTEADDGKLTQELKAFPRGIVFSAASGIPLTDERSIWQDPLSGFVSVNVGSIDASRPPAGRERMEDVLKIASDSHHLLLVYVYAKTVRIERRDFVTDEELGDPWTVDFDDPGKYSYERRAKEIGAPSFAPDAKVTVAQDARGIVVSFPSVPGGAGRARAYDYEVTARYFVDGLDKIALQKRVYSPAVCKAPAHEPPAVECIFQKDELVWDADLAFEVRPLSCFGVKGAAVSGRLCIESPVAKAKRLKEEQKRARQSAKAGKGAK